MIALQHTLFRGLGRGAVSHLQQIESASLVFGSSSGGTRGAVLACFNGFPYCYTMELTLNKVK